MKRANNTGTLYKRNGWYYFKKKVGNRIFCRSCKTTDRAEALKALEDFEFGKDLPQKARVAAMEAFLKPADANPTFDEAWQKYTMHPRNIAQSECARKENRACWEVLTRWLFGQNLPRRRTNCKAAHPNFKHLDDITPEVATEFLQAYQAAPHSRNRVIRVLKRIWIFNKMQNNPWDDFAKFKENPQRRRALTKEEVDRMINSATGDMKLMFLLGAYTGLRMSDCAKLRWDDFSPDYTALFTTPHKTKYSSGKKVQLPVHPLILSELQRIGLQRFGFVMPSYATMKTWKLSHIIQKHFSSCGLKEFTRNPQYRRSTPIVGFHSLRSTFITNMANAGAPLSLVRDLCGHVSEDMTQLYYRSNIDTATKYIKLL